MENFPPISTYSTQEIERLTTKAQQIFPFKNEEDLKVYGVLSVHDSVAQFITNASAQLQIYGAYTLEESLDMNRIFMQGFKGLGADRWKEGAVLASVPFTHVVPQTKICEMIGKIEKYIYEEKHEIPMKPIDTMIFYAKYVFDKAGASPFEKGILTGIINRLKTQQP